MDTQWDVPRSESIIGRTSRIGVSLRKDWTKALVVEKVVRKPESHHETGSAVGPMSGEAPEAAAVPISPGLENGAIPRHDDTGDGLRKVLNESRSSEPTPGQIIHKIPTASFVGSCSGSNRSATKSAKL
jgi:hypothetical protein